MNAKEKSIQESAVTALAQLQERATLSEGRWVGETVQVLYQRPRFLRSRRIMPGYLPELCYQYRLVTEDPPLHLASPDEALLLLGGGTLDDLHERRQIIAAGVFAAVEAHQPAYVQGALFAPKREL